MRRPILSILILVQLLAFSAFASAQSVTATISFTQNQSAVTSVPLSPTLTAIIAIGIVLAAWAAFRRKQGTVLMLLASTLVCGALTFPMPDASATGTPAPCTTAETEGNGVVIGCMALTLPSPSISAAYTINNFGFIDVGNTTGGPVTINSIQTNANAPYILFTDLNVNLPSGSGGPPTGVFPNTAQIGGYPAACVQGLQLANGAHCSLYLDSQS